MGVMHFWYILFTSFLMVEVPQVRSGDAEALLGLKASMDHFGVLQWGSEKGSDFCQWKGVKECRNGRVTKLVVENLNLSGKIDGESLNQLDQLRVLSFKENLLYGPIPEMYALLNLKSLFLNTNRFSGRIPSSLSHLHRLKIVVLFDNQLSGEIPHSLVVLSRLYVLYLQDNRLTGGIPSFNQSSLMFFNVSNNYLSGEIPGTAAMSKFDESSFIGNMDLCGEQVLVLCQAAPSPSPSYPPTPPPEIREHKSNKRLIMIIVLSIVGFFLVCITLLLLIKYFSNTTEGTREASRGGSKEVAAARGYGGGDRSRDDEGGKGGEGLGSLVFLGPGDEQMSYTMEDLLKASAETLGRGTMGSTYKAVMESGYIVTIKRLKDASYPAIQEFRRHIEILGRLRHPNLVPLRAYFQAQDERLLVYDYFPNGSLFSLLHGSRGRGGSKSLHWTSCLKIAEDLAAGLVCIHQNPGLSHGNLKSANVLLGPEFESCLTDYGLSPFRNPDSQKETSASSLFYRAPECRDMRRALTQQADVYSYGVLLLELLTGKTPFQDLVQEHDADIPKWVRAVREEEDSYSTNEEKLNGLVNIAMACVSVVPGERPLMRDVLRMIREARTKVNLSSNNSSDHSPGRWSDTVQSLPRDEQQMSI